MYVWVSNDHCLTKPVTALYNISWLYIGLLYYVISSASLFYGVHVFNTALFIKIKNACIVKYYNNMRLIYIFTRLCNDHLSGVHTHKQKPSD